MNAPSLGSLYHVINSTTPGKKITVGTPLPDNRVFYKTSLSVGSDPKDSFMYRVTNELEMNSEPAQVLLAITPVLGCDGFMGSGREFDQCEGTFPLHQFLLSFSFFPYVVKNVTVF